MCGSFLPFTDLDHDHYLLTNCNLPTTVTTPQGEFMLCPRQSRLVKNERGHSWTQRSCVHQIGATAGYRKRRNKRRTTATRRRSNDSLGVLNAKADRAFMQLCPTEQLPSLSRSLLGNVQRHQMRREGHIRASQALRCTICESLDRGGFFSYSLENNRSTIDVGGPQLSVLALRLPRRET